jgi:hypothetical protein
MNSRYFSELPAELICLIFEQCGSIQDLYSLVRASRQTYAVFTSHKRSILFALLQNIVSVEVLRCDATVTFRSSLFPLDYYCRFPASSADAFLDFMRDFERIDYTDKTITLDLLAPLSRLHSSIEYLIKDYCLYLDTQWKEVFARQGCPTSLPEPVTGYWDKLSRTELARLQRAFYRYDTCQNMARRVMASDFEDLGGYPQFAELLSAFKPWEVDEIGCVHVYILGRINQVTRKLEDDYVQSVVDAAKLIQESYCKAVYNTSPFILSIKLL